MKFEKIRNGAIKVMLAVQAMTKYTSRLMGHIAMCIATAVLFIYCEGSVFTDARTFTWQEIKPALRALIQYSAIFGTAFFGLGLALEFGGREIKTERVYHRSTMPRSKDVE